MVHFKGVYFLVRSYKMILKNHLKDKSIPSKMPLESNKTVYNHVGSPDLILITQDLFAY